MTRDPHTMTDQEICRWSLDVMGEVWNLQGYQRALERREHERRQIIAKWQQLWPVWVGVDWVPDAGLLHALLNRHTPDVIETALRVTAGKLATGAIDDRRDWWVRYLHGVIRRLEQESA